MNLVSEPLQFDKDYFPYFSSPNEKSLKKSTVKLSLE